MRVLVLGGTVFLGRHIVETLLARGVEVTLFHRGQRGKELFPQVERILGDRAVDLDRLPRGVAWDAAVDTSGHLPGVVASSARALADRAQRYVFVSSVSVYDVSRPAIDESTPMPDLPSGASAETYAVEHFGPLKRLCERAVLDAFVSDRALIVRPGLIVGPHDPSDRFTYWPLRFARGGDIAVPNDLAAPIQWIDVRDLAAFIVDGLERGHAGAVNAAGPEGRAVLGDLFGACAAAAGVPSRLVPIDRALLRAQNIEPWTDLPVWAPLGEDYDGIANVSRERALAYGMRFRPLDVTVADTLRWARDERGDAPLKAGLTPEREAALRQAQDDENGSSG